MTLPTEVKSMKRKIINKIDLINKLNSMPYSEISEAQMQHIFMELGRTITTEDNKESEIDHGVD